MVEIGPKDDDVTEENIDSGHSSELMIYNDEYNTFDRVIESLMEVLGHTSEQAEQLSILIHYKGKAIVKTASYERLKPFKDAFNDRGINATIEHSTA